MEHTFITAGTVVNTHGVRGEAKILPQGVENLLCPGRHLSADGVAIDWLDLIPQCVGTGQAAGVAAAVALFLVLREMKRIRGLTDRPLREG